MTQRETPGGETGGSSDRQGSGITSSVDHAADFVAQLRRRRATSQRMAILDNGQADPLDELARVPCSRQSTIAARRAWQHLRDHGLLSEHVEACLAEGAA